MHIPRPVQHWFPYRREKIRTYRYTYRWKPWRKYQKTAIICVKDAALRGHSIINWRWIIQGVYDASSKKSVQRVEHYSALLQGKQHPLFCIGSHLAPASNRGTGWESGGPEQGPWEAVLRSEWKGSLLKPSIGVPAKPPVWTTVLEFGKGSDAPSHERL